MYCQECGKYNQDAEVTCRHCGVTLEDNSKRQASPIVNEAAQQALKKLKSIDVSAVKKTSKKTKLIIGMACASIVLLVAAYFTASALTNPERVVKAYVDSCISGDYEKAYNVVAMPNSPFLTKEAFAAYIQQITPELTKIVNYEITSNESKDNTSLQGSLSKTYTVSYVLVGESRTNSFTVTLINQNQKQFLLSDTYKIAASGMFVEGYTIYAPDGSNITIDEIEISIDDTAINTHEPDLNAYVVPHLFSGEHSLKITSDIFEDYEETLYVTSSGNKTVKDFVLKESIIADLAKQTENTYISYMENAIKGNDFSKVDGDFTTNDSELSDMREGYLIDCEIYEQTKKSFSEVSKEEQSLVEVTDVKESISFTSITDSSNSNRLNKENRYHCKLNFILDDLINVFFLNMEENKKYSVEYSISDWPGYVEMSFEYSDGIWRICSIEGEWFSQPEGEWSEAQLL